MNPTKHAHTNYRMLKPFLDGLGQAESRQYEYGGYMPLSVNLLYKEKDGVVYSLAHYGEQCGDLMADPDMELKVNRESGTVEPLTYRNDFMGLFQEVYITQNGQLLYSKRLRSELDEFLWQWLKNIHDQGFTRCL